MRRLLVSLLLLLIVQTGFAHFRARYHVIVDTDGGVDDIRALCMMLASPEIEVLAITAVEGFNGAREAAERIGDLLSDFGHQGIPVATGLPDAVGLMMEALELEEMPVDILALGPLTNIAALFREDPSLEGSVRKLTWYSEELGRGGFNFDANPEAAGKVLASAVRTEIISSGEYPFKDLDAFLKALDTIRSDYAKTVKGLYLSNGGALKDHYMGRHLADDCVPVYLLFPELFTSSPASGDTSTFEISAIASSGLEDKVLQLLDADRGDSCILFRNFPVHPGLFRDDVAAMAGKVIEAHGLKEWKIVALTNEFHEHLGVYSIIGAKMGLRAREYFNIGIDELLVESCAGLNPPISCLSDGLQVSTGATLGHGTISIMETDPRPAARFAFKNTTIEIRLEPALQDRIREDVRKGVERYGLETPGYWSYIRKMALSYWLELDRREIFEILPVYPGN